MHRTDGAGNIAGVFVEEDTSTNQPPTEITAAWMNAVQEEIAAVIESTGVALVKATNTQLRDAIVAVINGKGAVQGAFKNLQASATGLNGLVNVTIDEVVVESAANAYQILRNVNLNAISTAGAGANGLDTGAIAINTWYSLWVIWNGAAVAGLLSLSATAPTMPNGYTHKARIGWIRTDSSANKYPMAFKQYGRRVRYIVGTGTNVLALPAMASGLAGNTTTPTWVAVSTSNVIPPTAAFINGSITFNDTGSSVIIIAAPNNSYGGHLGPSNAPPVAVGSAGASGPIATNIQFEFALESSNIYWANVGTSTAPLMMCAGWEDNI